MKLVPDLEAALVVVGHGSTQNDLSAQPVHEQVEKLRTTRLFGAVEAGFWKEPPQISEVLSQLRFARVYVVPFFVSEGYFSEMAIPRLIGFPPFRSVTDRVLVENGRTIIYTRPVGVHESITGVLLERARQVVEQHPFPAKPAPGEITLFVAGHGTAQSPSNRRAVEAHVQRIRGMGLYHSVHSVFLEEDPRIGECYGMSTTRYIVIVPCFLSDGLHVAEDIPLMLGEPESVVRRRLRSGFPTWRNPTERHDKLVWYSRAIGGEPHLPEVILALIEEAKVWIAKRSGSNAVS